MYFKEPYKTQLVEALRSGKYKQGRSALRRGDKFCCLGVACDIAPKKIGSWKLRGPDSNRYAFNGETVGLPSEVIEEIVDDSKPDQTKTFNELLSGTFTEEQCEKIRDKWEDNFEPGFEPKYVGELLNSSDRFSLIDLNDSYAPFTFIADIIEEFC